jgi:tripartite-type tricarboxylate transporter receptor subunit TctC
MSVTLPGFAFTNWFGLAAPLNLPSEVLEAWSRALLRVARDAELERAA